jgi:hypothetical protein
MKDLTMQRNFTLEPYKQGKQYPLSLSPKKEDIDKKR